MKRSDFKLFFKAIAIAIYLAIASAYLLSSGKVVLLALVFLISNKLLVLELLRVAYKHTYDSILIMGIGILATYQIAIILSRIFVFIKTSDSIGYAITLSKPYVFIPLGIITGIGLIILQRLTNNKGKEEKWKK